MSAALASSGRVPKSLQQRGNFESVTPQRSLGTRTEMNKDDPGAMPSPLGRSSTIAFTSQGQDVARFCEHAGRSGKFVFPSTTDQKPEVGRYRPEYGVVMAKAKAADFGERAPHEPRKPEASEGIQDGAGWHQDMFSPRMTLFAKHPTDVAGHRGTMKLESPRPELRKLAMVQLHEAPEHGKDWHTRDSMSSGTTRQPRWDFAKLPGRKKADPAGMVYFQPAMYEVHHESVEPSPKGSVAFSKQITYSEAPGQLRHAAPPSAAAKASTKAKKRGSGAENILPDRSLFRSNSAVSPRVLCVKELSKVPARKSLFDTTGSSWYSGDDDPRAEEALERELKYDASVAMRFVTRRTDVAPSLKRSQMIKGARPLPGTFELSRECTGWDAKEVPSRARKGLGTMSFHLGAGRSVSVGGQASPLRRPRSHAAPEFRRTAPAGFTTRTTVSASRPAL